MSKYKIAALLLCAAVLLAGCGKPQESAASSARGAASGAVSSAAEQQPPAVPVLPLTGLETEQESTRRPVAVMISNAATAASRQWGLADASVVIEALTEGKSTNLMLWYDSIDAVPKVGPITEGKDVFWQLALPENSLVAQRGSNQYAFNLLNCYAWQPLDALYTGVNCYDYDGSDPAIPGEYSWYTKGSSLQNGLSYYGLPADGPVPQWLHFGQAPAGEAAASVTVAYSVNTATTLTYSGGAYQMFRTDGAAQCDANTGAQASFANVLLLYCSAGVKDDRYTRDYDLAGGQGLYLTGGTWQTITWEKGDTAEPLRLFTADGQALSVTPGRTYLGIYGGFAGQSVALYDAEGAAIETGLAAPEPIAAAAE